MDGIAYNYHSVQRWSQFRNTNIFELDKFTAIITLPGHWAMVLANIQQRTVMCLDPKGLERPAYTNALKTFFQDEEILRVGNVTAPWEIVSAPINYPQQGADNNECGMFVCKYCNLLAENLPLNFSILDLNRIQVGTEILNGHIASALTLLPGCSAYCMRTDKYNSLW